MSLGESYDLSTGIAPVNLATAANTFGVQLDETVAA